ncbi:MAG: hypothetical protein K0S71_3038 [Clostridia bacterium]|jgi:uncharacterized protein involved in type VI secretion and phage assembly|nr:hypothetical protein [Clostridia bacterium]
MANSLGDILFNKENESKRQRAYDGSSIMPGILIGTVTINFNPLYPDKIQVEIPIGGQMSTVLVWAKMMSPSAGDGWGVYCIPEVGDKVIVSFVAGNTNKPIILGCIYQKTSNMLLDNMNLLNGNKKFTTKAGGEIAFESTPLGEKITIKTKKENTVILDDPSNTITVQGPKGKNLIKINSLTGAIEITADNSISIGAGQSKIELQKSGAVNVTCREFNVGSKANIKLDGNQVSISGTQVETKAAGEMKIQSTGPMKLQSSAILEAKGTMVKIN